MLYIDLPGNMLRSDDSAVSATSELVRRSIKLSLSETIDHLRIRELHLHLTLPSSDRSLPGPTVCHLCLRYMHLLMDIYSPMLSHFVSLLLSQLGISRSNMQI